MRSAKIDGNNILEVYSTISKIAAELRENPEPFLLECVTFRMRGHEEARRYQIRTRKTLMDEWAKKDPIENYEKWLLKEGVLSGEVRDSIHEKYKKQILDAVEVMFAEPEPVPDTEEELADAAHGPHPRT
jgi:2-oxoisovalerate dehydrogenase E1 component